MATALFKARVRCPRQAYLALGSPGTIDNDIATSDYTIGFDTAMNTAVDMIDRLRDTTESHDRCSVVEVMGRRCGDIAMTTGIAVGATAILVPELPFDFEKDIIDRINVQSANPASAILSLSWRKAWEKSELAQEIEHARGSRLVPQFWGMYSGRSCHLSGLGSRQSNGVLCRSASQPRKKQSGGCDEEW